MTARMKLAIAGSAMALILGAIVLWFNLIRAPHHQSAEQTKTTAELLVGKWKQDNGLNDGDAGEPRGFENIFEFTEDGKFECHSWDSIRGPRALNSGTYRVDGQKLQIFSTTSKKASPSPNETWELRNTIENITEDELVIATITRKRWGTEMARELAAIRGISEAQVLAEVREEHSRSTFVRIKD